LFCVSASKGCEGAEPELVAIVTLASSVDYTTSNSSLKLLLPLADPAEMLRVPAIPVGTLLSTTYPISSRAPYILSLLRSQISSKDMMDPDLLSKLVLNNFCTVPAKVLLQLTTAFRDGGLRNRAGTFFFKQHLHKIKVPILALAGDEDLICPPEAVYGMVISSIFALLFRDEDFFGIL
jgi:pimeloyl-ACP methyl ester carboxylesterase